MDGCLATPPYHLTRASCFLHHISRLPSSQCHSGLSPIILCSSARTFALGASFRQILTDLPLPSASGYPCFMMSSHRGLSPHKLMPMSGVPHTPPADARQASRAIQTLGAPA